MFCDPPPFIAAASRSADPRRCRLIVMSHDDDNDHHDHDHDYHDDGDVIIFIITDQ